ncbi:hypothetical protein O3P69_017840 [Scylla paramamosain]|uniref:Uncharacterized protein n=1 Tax=Scylla paramamosain TaxID=85552 RepID=A0AAW0TJL0_SCYPA
MRGMEDIGGMGDMWNMASRAADSRGLAISHHYDSHEHVLARTPFPAGQAQAYRHTRRRNKSSSHRKHVKCVCGESRSPRSIFSLPIVEQSLREVLCRVAGDASHVPRYSRLLAVVTLMRWDAVSSMATVCPPHLV